MNDEGDLEEDAVEPPTVFSPFLIMQKDAIDSVAKKINSLPPCLSAATDGADNAEAKREPVPSNRSAATHGADNAKGKRNTTGGPASSSAGPEESGKGEKKATALLKTQTGARKRARTPLLSPHSPCESAGTEEERAAIRKIVLEGGAFQVTSLDPEQGMGSSVRSQYTRLQKIFKGGDLSDLTCPDNMYFHDHFLSDVPANEGGDDPSISLTSRDKLVRVLKITCTDEIVGTQKLTAGRWSRCVGPCPSMREAYDFVDEVTNMPTSDLHMITKAWAQTPGVWRQSMTGIHDCWAPHNNGKYAWPAPRSRHRRGQFPLDVRAEENRLVETGSRARSQVHSPATLLLLQEPAGTHLLKNARERQAEA